MTRPGPIYWSPRPRYKAGLYVNGYRFADENGDGGVAPFAYKRPPAYAMAVNQAGTHTSQSRGMLGDQPLALVGAEGSLSIQLKWEEEMAALTALLSTGRPVSLYFGEWLEDRWWLFGAESDRTTFRTSRALPYDLPPPIGLGSWPTGTPPLPAGQQTYLPAAKLIASDGTETPQVVVTSGTPGAGEVMVPVTGGGLYETVTTPAVSTLGGAEYLALFYPAVMVARVELDFSYRAANDLRVEFGFEEQLAGRYEGAAAA